MRRGASFRHPRQREFSPGIAAADPSNSFEVVAAGKVYVVKGEALQRWIDESRKDWKGTRGLLFKQRSDLA